MYCGWLVCDQNEKKVKKKHPRIGYNNNEIYGEEKSCKRKKTHSHLVSLWMHFIAADETGTSVSISRTFSELTRRKKTQKLYT